MLVHRYVKRTEGIQTFVTYIMCILKQKENHQEKQAPPRYSKQSVRMPGAQENVRTSPLQVGFLPLSFKYMYICIYIFLDTHKNIYTHTHMYIYIYMCMCICICFLLCVWLGRRRLQDRVVVSTK